MTNVLGIDELLILTAVPSTPASREVTLDEIKA
jgi:hypothetical protein